MDWITGMQRALDYAEENLTSEIDFEEAAKKACSSPFHFQRMFTMLCGFSLGEYVRCRRLASAAEELIMTKEKVIDIALKYGYDTPESFSRAFARFHGITPTEARRGGNVRSFSRLNVKLILTGGNKMDYRIEKKDALKLICRRKQIEKPQGESATEEISAFWGECNADGTMADLARLGRFDRLRGILGVCFSDASAASGFPYGIGAEYNGGPLDGTGLEILDVPAHTYAVFQCRGKMPDAFKETYRQICTEFFPQSNYEYAQGVEFEVYPSDDVTDPAYACEIWIAVREKK